MNQLANNEMLRRPCGAEVLSPKQDGQPVGLGAVGGPVVVALTETLSFSVTLISNRDAARLPGRFHAPRGLYLGPVDREAPYS